MEVGFATHFSWYQPDCASLPLLAVAFENAVAIYSIQLPVLAANGSFQPVEPPTSTTVVASTPMLEPIGALRLGSVSTILQCAWFSHEYLIVLTQPSSVVMVFHVKWPLYQPLKQRRTVPLSLLTHDAEMAPSSLLYLGDSVCGVTEGDSVFQLQLSSSTSDEKIVCSIPIGLDSVGDALFMDSASESDGTLHVVSSAFCERFKRDDGDLFYWTAPSKRYWLCKTTVGETRESHHADDVKHGFPEDVTDGAITEVLCELTQFGRPNGIVRCNNQAVCAISFHEKKEILLVDYTSDAPLQMKSVQGRSIVFLPADGEATGLLLSHSSAELTFFQWTKGEDVSYSASYRPILGVDEDEDFVSCVRVSLFSEGRGKVSLMAVGRRMRDRRHCIISGEPCKIDDVQPDNWSKLLPNIVTGRSFWLQDEEVSSTIVGLQGDGNGYRNFALATSSRVLILSSALTVAAESQGTLGPTCGLAPVGSFATCFVRNHKIRYLSCVDTIGTEESSVIATLPGSQHILLAICQDRAVLYPIVPGLVASSEPDLERFSVSLAVLKPALVFEPLLANAVCADGLDSGNPFLRKVVERFGRVKSALAHNESEGIGNIGVGLTSRAFALLEQNKLHDANSWLLTGTAAFERSSNTRILPPWLPMSAKYKGARNADGLLHILSYGDSYLADYMKSSESESSSTLPRRTDPTATACRDYGKSTLSRGHVHDATKLLDLSGNESSDLRILQLVLHGRRNNERGILRVLGGMQGRGPTSVAASLAHIADGLDMPNDDIPTVFAERIAPSSQIYQPKRRSRPLIFRDSVLRSSFPIEPNIVDSEWKTPCQEAKHVWYV